MSLGLDSVKISDTVTIHERNVFVNTNLVNLQQIIINTFKKQPSFLNLN